MLVFSDSTGYAEQVLPSAEWRWSQATSRREVRRLIAALYGDRPAVASPSGPDCGWKYLFVVDCASRSHFDILIDLSRAGEPLPDRMLCVARTGRFHGQRNRTWSAAAGNIHLSAYLTPNRIVPQPGIAFTVLAAVSVLEVVEAFVDPEHEVGIKWVNDVWVGGGKVGGVLAYTQSEGPTVTTAVVGVGCNVESAPSVPATRFVPRVGAVRDFARRPRECSLGDVLPRLLTALEHNYRLLLDGALDVLLDRYRRSSLVIGRDVAVCEDGGDGTSEVIASGRVIGLTDDLELLVEGVDRPLGSGRLILGPAIGHDHDTVGTDPSAYRAGCG